MKLFLARSAALVPFVATACATVKDQPANLLIANGAQAMLLDANGGNHGTAWLTQAADGIVLTVEARGLPPGPKGMHVHAVGECRGPDFVSAGGHWNLTGHEHGTSNPAGPHVGDLPNLEVDSAGAANFTAAISRGSLFDGDHPLLGSGLVDYSQKMMVAARAMAEKKAVGQRS